MSNPSQERRNREMKMIQELAARRVLSHDEMKAWLEGCEMTLFIEHKMQLEVERILRFLNNWSKP